MILTVGLVFPTTANVQAAETADAVPGEIVVKFKDEVGVAKATSALESPDTEVVSQNTDAGFAVVKVKDASVQATIKKLSALSNVEYAEPNILFHTMATPNDPDFSKQWGLTKINAPAAWEVTEGDSSVKVAVVDTGVDYNHPDLAGKVIKGGDFIDNDNDPMDENGHGTHVAGIAAANTNNGIGIAGTAPGVSIYAVRVLDANGSGSLDAVASGIRDAADAGSEVINLSLGALIGAQTLKDAVDYARSQGSVVVAAAGNDGLPLPSYPAYYDSAIAVASTTSSDSRSSFSSFGWWVDIAAPGSDIYSTVPGGGYGSYSGTSMATPHAAGVAGLLASQGRSADEIEEALFNSAEPISGTGLFWNYGRIDAAAAVGY
ncbi:S8 family peptidase [Desmospora activa]|uniref:Thermitase n=1 Tax=Desmospora activa DSM 45169 TaxID=1121389 RepID=A0A2T4Z0R3_9BACL|nr:thermitase [Desmospora activa DSM 45169]